MFTELFRFEVRRPVVVAGAVLIAMSWEGAGVTHASSRTKVAAAPDVQVSQAWIRATVKGQMGTGGFMTLTSTQGATLLGFTSAVAKTNQVHEMAMDGDVMRMRELANLPLPAGQAVALKPGGYHLMLINLKQTLKVGDQVPLTLKFKDTKGRVFTQQVKVPVQTMPPVATDAGKASGPMDHSGHMNH